MKIQAILLFFPYAIDAFTGPSSACHRRPIGLAEKNRISHSPSIPATARGQPLFVSVADLSADSPEPDLTPEEELELVKRMMGDMEDIKDPDLVLKEVEVMQKRPQYLQITDRTDGVVSIQSRGCAVDVAIDFVALCLTLFNIPGGGKVAKKLLDQLDPWDRYMIEQLMKQVAKNPKSMPTVAFKVMQLIISELSWRAIKNAFSDFGWWDATQIALTLIAIPAAGPALAIINYGLNIIAITALVKAILACPELVG